MARNKRKRINDKDAMKTIRKTAKRRWRNKKATEKALKNAADAAEPPNEVENGPKPVPLPGKPHSRRARPPAVKEIRSTEVVRGRFLGSGTFGSCYLGTYRGYVVAVKEFKVSEKMTSKIIRKEVFHEAEMISHLGDHRCLPLLFGVSTKKEPLRLITQFHGEKDRSLTLSSAVRKKAELGKPSWLAILRDIIDGLGHIHKRGILHNDLKANNVVLEKRKEEWNPVIIDFGKARMISDPKPPMSLSENKQREYRMKYPHIAPEIVRGEGAQSVLSDIFSLGKIALEVLDILPTATAESIKSARRACCEEPTKRPTLMELRASL